MFLTKDTHNAALVLAMLICLSIYFFIGCGKTTSEPVSRQPPQNPLVIVDGENKGTRRADVKEKISHPSGYLDETKSKQWLKTHDYQIEKTKDGYIVKKRGVTSGRTVIDFKYTLDRPNEKHPLREGVTLIYQNGKIYISKK